MNYAEFNKNLDEKVKEFVRENKKLPKISINPKTFKNIWEILNRPMPLDNEKYYLNGIEIVPDLKIKEWDLEVL